MDTPLPGRPPAKLPKLPVRSTAFEMGLRRPAPHAGRAHARSAARSSGSRRTRSTRWRHGGSSDERPAEVRQDQGSGPARGLPVREGRDQPRRQDLAGGRAVRHRRLQTIEFTSFVSPKWVPQMADADQMVAGIKRVPGVAYEAIWLNEAGLERAAKPARRRSRCGRCSAWPAPTRSCARTPTAAWTSGSTELPGWAERYQKLGMDWIDVGVMAAFGCNYEGDVTPKQVVTVLAEGRAEGECAAARGSATSAWPTRWAGRTRCRSSASSAPSATRWPSTPVKLHLHDTRALAVANVRRRARGRRRLLRQRGGRPGRLPVRRPQGRGRQRHHRGRGLPLPGDGRARPASISTR